MGTGERPGHGGWWQGGREDSANRELVKGRHKVDLADAALDNSSPNGGNTVVEKEGEKERRKNNNSRESQRAREREECKTCYLWRGGFVLPQDGNALSYRRESLKKCLAG